MNKVLHKHLLAALCITPLLFGASLVQADDAVAPAADVAPAAATAEAAPAEAAPPYTITYNLGITSGYVSRGVNISDGPALQGGVDWAHSSGFYLGAWASTVNPLVLGKGTAELPSAPNGAALGSGNHIETDWYGGYTHAFGPVTLGIGGNYVWYPEGEKSYHDRNQDTFEGNLNVSAFGFTYTFYHAFTDWYGIGNTRTGGTDPAGVRGPTAAESLADTSGAEYHEFKYAGALPFGGLSLNAKVGYQRSNEICLDQKDVLIGLSRSFSLPGASKPIDGFTVGGAYTQAFDEEKCSKATAYYTDNHFVQSNDRTLTFYIKRSW
jgi:uncharacterized protein (TIGR02001 family)